MIVVSDLHTTALAPEIGSADTVDVEAPEVRFAKSGDVNIAYSIVGDGPFDLVFVGGWVLSNHQVAWEGVGVGNAVSIMRRTRGTRE